MSGGGSNGAIPEKEMMPLSRYWKFELQMWMEHQEVNPIGNGSPTFSVGLFFRPSGV